jgi:hypothetical protein
VAEFLDSKRVDFIRRTAWALWEMFMEKNFKTFTDADLFRPYGTFSRPQNACAVAFLQFCGDLYADTAGLAVTQTSLEYVWPTRPSRAVSWLANFRDTRGLNNPILAIDVQYLETELPISDIHRKCTKLLLHEVGHLVLHWRDFITQIATRQAGKLANLPAILPDASGHQESEAWLFCYSVLTAAIARHAFLNRRDDDNDATWRLL